MAGRVEIAASVESGTTVAGEVDGEAAAIGLRYTLMPYLWSLFERASGHGEISARPA